MILFDLCMSVFMFPFERLQFLFFISSIEEQNLSEFESRFQFYLEKTFFKKSFTSHVWRRHVDCSHLISDLSEKGNFFYDVFDHLYSFFIRDVLLHFDCFVEHVDDEMVSLNQLPCISVIKKYPFPTGWLTDFELIRGKLHIEEVRQYFYICVKFHIHPLTRQVHRFASCHPHSGQLFCVKSCEESKPLDFFDSFPVC